MPSSAPMTGPSAAEPPTQDRLIADALIADIVEWRIAPGAWLREREVAQRFGVSHAPVREAFRHVARVGFIKIVPWRGAHVIDLDAHAAIEVFELWKALFGVICRMAAQAFNPADGQELLRRIEAFKTIVRETPDTLAHLAVSNSIGSFIAHRSGAPMASELLDRVALFARWQHHVLRVDYLESIKPRPGIRSAELYEALCHHIVHGEADAADRAAHELLAFLQKHFEPALDLFLAERKTEPAKRRCGPRA